MKNLKNILFFILWIVILIGIIVGSFFLTNAIINSDLPNWWKWIFLK